MNAGNTDDTDGDSSSVAIRVDHLSIRDRLQQQGLGN